MTSTLPFTEEEDLASTDVLGVPAAAHTTESYGKEQLRMAGSLCSYIPETLQLCQGIQWGNAVVQDLRTRIALLSAKTR